ncbi:MAG: hypothetical protein JWQ43_724 [Glaciihabitans sp.]|nr:hypothetical protein [Glaciihabitans sp.]
MKHVTFAEKSLIMGDEVTELLLRYTVLLSKNGSADTVEVAAVGADGGEVMATLVLDMGSALMAESVVTSQPEPDNTVAIAYVRSRIDAFDRPQYPISEPADTVPRASYDEFEV